MSRTIEFIGSINPANNLLTQSRGKRSDVITIDKKKFPERQLQKNKKQKQYYLVQCTLPSPFSRHRTKTPTVILRSKFLLIENVTPAFPIKLSKNVGCGHVTRRNHF